ncbi:MAG: MBL fold metallo-hydrolase [Clostridia bacterium]|nr:MBL fold metallo-hydrolase [Clostridia bacterium]
MTKICPLFSSSRGNSIYVGSEKSGILVDVGRSAKQIEKGLVENGISVKSIKAIFITHEHSDHIQGVRIFASRYNIKVYSSKGTIQALDEKGILDGGFSFEVIDEAGAEISNMYIKPFKTPHDSSESVGYMISTQEGKKAVIATDIGYMSDDIKKAIVGAHAVVIESNHDVRMLQNGGYPYYLKRRILSNIGHLSNEACADVLPFFVETGSTKFILAHLSQENNIPELAYETAICNLKSHKMVNNVDFQLHIAPAENYGSLCLTI